MQNGYVESFNGRMRDELLNETLFLNLDHARVVDDYNRERPHSALGYETPAAFAAELHKQWPERTGRRIFPRAQWTRANVIDYLENL
jgi:putative transposase